MHSQTQLISSSMSKQVSHCLCARAYSSHVFLQQSAVPLTVLLSFSLLLRHHVKSKHVIFAHLTLARGHNSTRSCNQTVIYSFSLTSVFIVAKHGGRPARTV